MSGTNHMLKCVVNTVLQCKNDEQAIYIMGCEKDEYQLLNTGYYIEGYMGEFCKDIDARISTIKKQDKHTTPQKEKLFYFLKYLFEKSNAEK